MTAKSGTTPLCVDEALQLVPEHPPLQCRSSLPGAAWKQHRVQLSVRGRRFEMAMDVALSYSLTLQYFFLLRIPTAPSTSSLLWMAAAGDQERTVARESEAAAWLGDDALLNHYCTQVSPAVRRDLSSLVQRLPQVDACGAESSEAVGTTAKQESRPAKDPWSSSSLPEPPAPDRVSFNPDTHLWSFVFRPRLTPAEEEAEKRRVAAELQRGKSASAKRGEESTDLGVDVVGSLLSADRLNSSPFLLLQCDYLGILLVYLRRCTKVLSEQQPQTDRGHDEAARSPPSYPVLPLRWAEMNYDEQVELIQLIRVFGVTCLLPQYARPSASISSSLFVGADAVSAATQAAREGEALSLRVEAQNLAEARWQDQQQKSKVACRDDENDDDDGETPPVVMKGCIRCGLSGHSQEECLH